MRRVGELIDQAWPRAAFALLALAAVIAIVAAASGSGTPEPDKVKDAVHNWGQDLATRASEKACAAMTTQAQAAILAIVPTVSCPTYLRSFSLEFNPRALEDADLRVVQISGNNATVPAAAVFSGGQPFGTGFALQKIGGVWLIAGILK